MNNYKKLAIRYLKMNKRRSIVTVFGVTVAVAVLYAILNLGWSALLNFREMAREEQDYEIVLLTETENQIKQIMADERVKSASVGKYCATGQEIAGSSTEYGKIYESALYINTANPYRMKKTAEQLKNAYGVGVELNEMLAAAYLQAGEDNLIYVSLLFILLISFIFAIFGVGIVRNSIQLSTLEQIKDYGNLRCVGAAKKQLKAVIYIEGTILELTGNAIGVLVGFIISLIIGHYLKLKVGIHFVPIVPLLIAFLGDLYFAMEENCKVIVNMTPVSAIRGEYRIRKEKIKVRRQSIFGKLFGIEGDYAYKSIMRNPGRFHKTVWALGIGIAAFIAVTGSVSTLKNVTDQQKERHKYYHIYFEVPDAELAGYEVEGLPPTRILQKISDMEELTEAKCIYSSPVALTDYDANYEHYTEDYLSQTVGGASCKSENYLIKNQVDIADGEGFLSENIEHIMNDACMITCYGYDESDYERYQSALIDGTLDISENGLVLVNGGNVIKDTDEDLIMPEYMDVEYTDYKVGDTIDIVDMAKYRTMVNEKLESLKEEYEANKAKLPDVDEENVSDPNAQNPELELEKEYNMARYRVGGECRQQLIEEGAYKTYTIEGIVSEDVNRHMEEPVFILPLKQYYAFTGTDESMTTGMQYHFDKFPAKKFLRIIEQDGLDFDLYSYTTSEYIWIMDLVEDMKNINLGIMAVITFIVLMSTLNIINTTASNLHLRRKEFAQLRVIGISKKRLMKTVMLEGVISAIVANAIGIILGVVIIKASLQEIIYVMLSAAYHFPLAAAVVGVIASTLILCGSIYVPLRGLKQDMAADLATGGD